MTNDLDEETQLAIALSISQAEAEGKLPPSQLRPSPLLIDQDAALAKKLQEEYDREASGAAGSTPTTAPSSHSHFHHAPTNLPSHHHHLVDAATCAGCLHPLSSRPSGSNFLSSLASLAQPTRYITALGKNWHPECFVCSECKRPFAGGRFSVTEDGPMHQECYKQKHHPKCNVCGDYLPYQDENGVENRIVWHSTPFWNDKSCPEHARDGTPRCTSCQRLKPRSEQWADLDDGRVLCLLCLGSVVPDTASAQPLYQNILSFYQKLGMPLPAVPPLSLVDNSALNAATNQQGPRADGPIFHTRGLCLLEYRQRVETIIRPALSFLPLPEMRQTQVGPQQCSVSAILVLKGLPKLLTGCIIAHECMHAWLRLSGYGTDLPLEVEEGLCQLMALLWLEAQPEGQGGARQRQNSDPGSEYEERLAAFLGNQIRTDQSIVYGDGLRAALEAFQTHGLATVLAHVRHAKRFP